MRPTFSSSFCTAGAIEIAKNGHKISKVVSNAWHNSLNKINGNENSKKIFLKEGRTYQENELMKNIPLGKTLEAISKKGSKEFYEGETAKDIIESLNELGGVHTVEDFSKQNTIRSETIKSSYKGDFIPSSPARSRSATSTARSRRRRPPAARGPGTATATRG